MFLKIYKTNKAYLILLIPITAIFFWLKGFINCDFIAFNSNHSFAMPLYALINPFVNANCYISLSITIILVLIQGFYLSNLNKKFIFIKQRSFLHAFIFLLLVSSNDLNKFATPAIFANIFILLSINWLFSSYKKQITNNELFNSGIFLAIAGLFYINSILLLPIIIIAYIQLHTIRIKELLVIITGFITPFIIASGILFITDELFIYTNNIWKYILNVNYNFDYNIYNNIFYIWLVVLVFISIISVSGSFGTKKISSRKFLSIFLYIIVYNTAIYFLLPFSNMEMLVITSAPIAFIITDFYVNRKNGFINEMSFSILIISYILIQIFV